MSRCMMVAVAILLLIAASTTASDVSIPDTFEQEIETNTMAPAAYPGTLRIYIVEPYSRYRHPQDSGQYHNGFLDFALVQTVNIADGARLQVSADWNASSEGFGSIAQDNIAAIAVLFDETAHYTDALPPYGYWFNAYYADAAAQAAVGELGSNAASNGYTHKVFLEELTEYTCSSCPSVRDWVIDLAGSNDGLLYTALVSDQNSNALTRRGQLNGPSPVCIVDGGHSVAAGSSSQTYISNAINASGARAVPNIDMLVTTEWIATNQIRVSAAVGNGVDANVQPNTPMITSGDTEGVPATTYTYGGSTTDPDGNRVSYRFDFDDGTISDWSEPCASGASGSASHSWTDPGTYVVRMQAKDIWGYETPWCTTTRTVTISAASCCTGPSMGNIDGSADNLVTMGDLTTLIAHMFITLEPLVCAAEANVDLSADELITMGDLTVLISHMFITLEPLPPCP